MIAVVGATGQQGGATARALLAAGSQIRALTRSTDSDRATALADAGAELVVAELDDPGSLERAFAGASSVFAMTTFTGEAGVEGEMAHGRAIADAAVAADVGFLLYSSVGGAERHTGIPHFESKRRVEEHIEQLGIAAAFLRPVFFMDNLLRTAVEDGEAVVRLALPDGIPLQLVAATDIGRAAAAILRDPTAVDGAIEIAGDELTGSQIATVFGTQAGVPGRYEPLPLGALDDDSDLQAMFAWFAEVPAYEADIAATRTLVPELMDTATWLAGAGWGPGHESP